MAELLKSDGTVGKCARCNRKIVAGERYAELHGVLFSASCIPFVQRVEHLFSDPEVVVELVREQHRLLTSAQTRAGWAKRKARLAAETQPVVDVEMLLGMGM
jgi:hypothetical protein